MFLLFNKIGLIKFKLDCNFFIFHSLHYYLIIWETNCVLGKQKILFKGSENCKKAKNNIIPSSSAVWPTKLFRNSRMSHFLKFMTRRIDNINLLLIKIRKYNLKVWLEKSIRLKFNTLGLEKRKKTKLSNFRTEK